VLDGRGSRASENGGITIYKVEGGQWKPVQTVGAK
jgi:hypothetical protein